MFITTKNLVGMEEQTLFETLKVPRLESSDHPLYELFIDKRDKLLKAVGLKECFVSEPKSLPQKDSFDDFRYYELTKELRGLVDAYQVISAKIGSVNWGKSSPLNGLPLPTPGLGQNMSALLLTLKSNPVLLVIAFELPDIELPYISGVFKENCLVLSTGISEKTLYETPWLNYKSLFALDFNGQERALLLECNMSLDSVGEFRLSGDFDSGQYKIPTVEDLGSFLGSNAIFDLLPQPLRGSKNIGLKSLFIDFNIGSESNKGLRSLGCQVGLNEPWGFCDDSVFLKDLTLDFSLSRDSDSILVPDVSIYASVKAFDVESSVLFDSSSGSLAFILKEVALDHLATKISGGSIQLPDLLKGITVKRAEINHDFHGGSTMAQVKIHQELSLADERLKSKLHLQIGHGNASIPAKLVGEVEFLGMKFTSDIQLSSKPVFKASAKSLKLSVVLKSLLNEELPQSVPDLVLERLDLSHSSEKGIVISGTVSSKKSDSLTLNGVLVPFDKLNFEFIHSQKGSKGCIKVSGDKFPHFDSLGLGLRRYEFEYFLEKEKGKKSDWRIAGSLGVEAFDRIMTFDTEVKKQEDARTFTFKTNNVPIVKSHCFDTLKEVDGDELISLLEEKEYVKNGVLKPDLDLSKMNLGKGFTESDTESIVAVLKKIKNNEEPLVRIPDLFGLSVNPLLCEINPIGLSLEWSKKAKGDAIWKFSGTSDFNLYDFFEIDKSFIRIKKGELTLFKEGKKKGLSFSSKSTKTHPLKWIPGLQEAMPALMGEFGDPHPKATTFMELFELGIGSFDFIKDGDEWSLDGGLDLKMTDGLKTIHKDLFEVCERFFPTIEDERRISGRISLSSKAGLKANLLNDSGILLPNLLEKAVHELDPDLRASINQGFVESGIDTTVEEMLDLGESFVRLEQIEISTHKNKLKFKPVVAIGLPSKLNDRLFGKKGKLNGLIKTYDQKKLKKLNGKTYPDDNLLRVGLEISTDGIGGSLEHFGLIDQNVLSKLVGESIAKCYQETGDSIELDFDTLMTRVVDVKPENRVYGRVKFIKPEFKLSTKDGSFYAKGGIHVLSDQLKIPIRPLAKKVLSFLPLVYLKADLVNQLTDKLIEGIPIRSIDFFKATDQKDENGKKQYKEFNLDDLEDWLISMLGPEHKDTFKLPDEFKSIVKTGADATVNQLPERFKEYLGIVLPKGFDFEINVSADKSLSFSLEVDQNAAEKDGLRPYIQLLLPPDPSMPMYMYGVRLRKIGFGSMIFNQFLRLDVSGDLDMFNLVHLASSLVLPEHNSLSDDLKLLVPDKSGFAQTLRIRDLIVMIIPQTEIPIPVPLFYNEIYQGYWGLEGVASEMSFKFSKPEFNLVKIMKRFAELINFFRDGKESLHVPTHYLAKLDGVAEFEPELIPAFRVGPLYYDLPGFFGYEIKDGKRRKVKFGFTDEKIIDFFDLVGLGANALKFSVFHLALDSVPKEVPVKSARDSHKINAKVPPVNYLIQYFDVKDRIGSKHLKLFYLFDIDFAWAISTPQEFKEKAYPLLVKKSGSDLPYPHTAESILAIVPNQDNDSGQPEGISNTDQGAVLFLKGALNIGGLLGTDTALAVVVSEELGFATAISFRAHLAKVLKMELWAMNKLNTNGDSYEVFYMAGSSRIEMAGADILKGEFSMHFAKGFNAELDFEGYLDLFPSSIYGNSFPIRLFSTESATSPNPAKIAGHFGRDKIEMKGGVRFEFGVFKLGGSIEMYEDGKNGKLETTLALLDSTLVLKAAHSGSRLTLSGHASPINLAGLIKITGAETNGGPSAELQIDNYVLSKFRLSGQASLFGLVGVKTLVDLNQKGFKLKVGAEIGQCIDQFGTGYDFYLDITPDPFTISGTGKAWTTLDLKLDLGELGILNLAQFEFKPSLHFSTGINGHELLIHSNFRIKLGDLPEAKVPVSINKTVPLDPNTLSNLKDVIEGLMKGKEVIEDLIKGFKDPSIWADYARKGFILAANGAKMLTKEVDDKLRDIFGVSPGDIASTACAVTNLADSFKFQLQLMAFMDDDDLEDADSEEVMKDSSAQLNLIRELRADLLKESRENPSKKGTTMGEWYNELYESLSGPLVDFFHVDSDKGGTGDFNYLIYSDEQEKPGIKLYKELIDILLKARRNESVEIADDFFDEVSEFISHTIDITSNDRYKGQFEEIAKGLEDFLEMVSYYEDEYRGVSYQTIRDERLPQQTPDIDI